MMAAEVKVELEIDVDVDVEGNCAPKEGSTIEQIGLRSTNQHLFSGDQLAR